MVSKVAFPLADVVTFRAVEKFSQVLALATRFLAPNARLAVLVSAPQLPELKQIPAMTWLSIHVPQSRQRLLLLGSLQNHPICD